ncbi:MAG: SusC/RagA family TonB-linked outer membrane protein [Rikenellaceae bacterium]
MKKFYSLFVILLTMTVSVAFAQSRQVTGSVKSAEDDLPIAGATVIVTGTSMGAITDENGNYTINNVNGDISIAVNFFGYKEAKASVSASATRQDFLLTTDALSVDEVVVTGLGLTREKKALGYAVQEVDGEELSNVRTGNVVSSLSGRVAGVQIRTSSGQLGGGARINVRGNTSLTGNNQPLFVVDGVPISNEDFSSSEEGATVYNRGNLAADISPDDIESMSILKGASATAIYGSRGANGVVLITTKKAKQGSKSFGVSINSSVAFDNVGIMPQFQTLYGGGSDDANSTISINGTEYKYPDFSTDESWGPKFNGEQVLNWNSFDEWDTEHYMKTKAWEYPENDYKSYYKTGVTYTNNIQISGSNEKSSFRISYTNYDQTGTTDNSELKRNSISINGTSQLNKYLDVWGTANYVKTEGSGYQKSGYYGGTMYQWSQTQLDYVELRDYINPDGTQRAWNRVSWDDNTVRYSDNPFWVLNESTNNDSRDRFYGNAGFNIAPLDGLKITARAGVDAFMYTIEERLAVGSQAGSYYALTETNSTELNMDLFAHYTKRIMDNKIGISAMIGTNSNTRSVSYMKGKTVGSLVIPGVYNLSNSQVKADIADTKSLRRINAVYANFTVDYDQLVYLDITGRNDWSSTLPASNRSYFYPSVNLSIMLNELGSLKDVSWLDFAKLRAGVAQVGNDTDPYSILNYYTIESPFGDNIIYDIDDAVRDPNLRPERTNSWEVGFEAQLFNRRLGLDISYYQKDTKDLIVNATTTPATGYTSQFINAGSLHNSGLELTLNANALTTKTGFTWDMQFNIATLKSEVTKIADGVDFLDLGNSMWSTYSGAILGESYPMLYGKDFVYGENGERLVGDNGYYLTTSSSQALAQVNPDFTAGLSSTFTWKGIELSILFDMQMGGHQFYNTADIGLSSGILYESAMPTNVPGKTGDIRESGYIVEGAHGMLVYDEDSATYKGVYTDGAGNQSSTAIANDVIITGQQYSKYALTSPSAFIYKTDFIKLREVRLGYTIPNRFTGPIKDIRISAYGRNLATFMADQDHFDPEYMESSGTNGQGIERGYIPTTRTLGFSIGLKF